MKARIIKLETTAEDLEWITKANKSRGLVPTGEALEIDWESDSGITKETEIIFKGRWTPYGYARNTGKHIVYAGYTRFYKFDLEGNLISSDAEDDDSEK